jgi:hypothetical protein
MRESVATGKLAAAARGTRPAGAIGRKPVSRTPPASVRMRLFARINTESGPPPSSLLHMQDAVNRNLKASLNTGTGGVFSLPRALLAIGGGGP